MASENNITLGEYLRHERERRGITIEQVASATKIGIKLLHALEGDQYAELPAKPFIRGFVTSYARFVGLDAREILTRHGEFIEKRALDRPVRDSGHSGYAFEKKEGDQSRTILGFVMLGFLVIGGLVFFLLKPNLHQSRHGTQLDRLRAMHPSSVPGSPGPSPSPGGIVIAPVIVPSSPTPVPTANPPVPSPLAPVAVADPATRETAVPAASPSPFPSPSPTLAAKPSEKDPLSSGADLKLADVRHKVIVKALESLFVRYQVDNRPVNQFILRKERILVLRAHDQIRLQVSNIDSISFNYNSEGSKPAAESDFVVTRQNDATLFFPRETAETIQEPFPGAKPLKGRKVPQPAASPGLSTTDQ